MAPDKIREIGRCILSAQRFECYCVPVGVKEQVDKVEASAQSEPSQARCDSCWTGLSSHFFPQSVASDHGNGFQLCRTGASAVASQEG